MLPRDPWLKGLILSVAQLGGADTSKRWGVATALGCWWGNLHEGYETLAPSSSVFCFFLLRWVASCQWPHHAVPAVVPQAQSMGQADHGLELPKLWANINIFSFWVDYFRHLVIAMEKWLTHTPHSQPLIYESVLCFSYLYWHLIVFSCANLFSCPDSFWDVNFLKFLLVPFY